MSIEQTNLNILRIIVDLKIKPSDFINIFKTKKDLNQVIKYFLTEEKNCLRLFKESSNKVNTSDKITSFIKYLTKNNSFMLNISQKQYPELLREIYFPPPLLFCKGEKIIKENSLKIAVVGTRNCSDYGKEVAAYISRALSKIGFMIASGMALGIDRTVHMEALKEAGGSIGVLGTGIDITYPYENKKLYNEIIENGGLVTEFLPGTPPLKGNFPARNRIISGMSIGVIVIEAGERSGAVVTAKSAVRENREVFAVPGNIFSDKSKGCHMLIKSGAKLIENIDDVLEELSNYINNPIYQNSIKSGTAGNSENSVTGKRLSTAQDEKHKNNHYPLNKINPENFPDDDYLKVFNCLGCREKSLEEIIRESCLNINKVLQIVSYFQLNNIIKENSFNNFVKVFY
ncbi:MAG: DNA-processing protein DprA [Candidatus Humimicrobiaceae bacterium]